MASIESIGSAMTYQAQIIPQTAVQSGEETTIQNEQNNASSAESASKVDPAILNVKESENTDQQDSSQDDGEENGTLASNDQLKAAIAKFNKSLTTNTEAVFGIHEKTQRVMIKIIDKDSKKVIKELPPEKTLDMLAKMWEMAGILVDEKR